MKNYSHDMRMGLIILSSALFLFLTGKYLSAVGYAMSPIQVSYLPIPGKEKQIQELYNKQVFSKYQTSMVELNSADSTQLVKQLKIPAYWSSKIINYREQLGGFANKNQLLEIYHFPEGIYERIYSNIHVDVSLVSPLGINQKTTDELGLHPYLSFQEAKIIINYRNLHGPYTSLEKLQEVKGIANETVQRLMAYLAKDFELIHGNQTPVSSSH